MNIFGESTEQSDNFDEPFEYALTPAQSNALRARTTFEEFRLKDVPSMGWGPLLVSEDREADIVAIRISMAAWMLHDCVEISSDKRNSVPVFRGTRFPVSRLLSELAENEVIDNFAADYDLDPKVLREFLAAVSIHLDRPFSNDQVSVRPVHE